MRRTRVVAVGASLLAVSLVTLGLVISGVAFTSTPKLLLATTTSVLNSGLLDYILADFKAKYNYRVLVLGLGSGQALETAKRGDADVVLSHAPSLELQFIRDRHGVFRWDVMYNHFIIVGPPGDPAGVATSANASDAFVRIYNASATFVSRGDDSGTHVEERELWGAAGLNPASFGSWYRSVGKGMGETLRMTDEWGGYTLADEGTFFALEATLTLREHFRNDTRLHNQYSVIPVNPDKNLNINVRGAMLFAEWLVSQQTQELIASYEVNGHQLFYPDAQPP